MSSVVKRGKRRHRKSRAGCSNCKVRKIKCDELQPTCQNCLSFSVPCSFSHDVHLGYGQGQAVDDDPQSPSPNAAGPSSSSPLPRRGRGRPRKLLATQPTASVSTDPVHLGPSVKEQHLDGKASLHFSEAEILHHFITQTGPGIASEHAEGDPRVSFWSDNVPQIGHSDSYVMHLTLSLAAYHLAHISRSNEQSAGHYRAIAKDHFSTGLDEMSSSFSMLSRENCSSLYVATILFSFCSLAAGPSSSGDLLVCDINHPGPSQWLFRARGSRLLNQLFSAEELFSGLTEPLKHDITGPSDTRPSYQCLGLERLDWEGPLEKIREAINSRVAAQEDVYIMSYERLRSVYNATFGDENGMMQSSVHYKMVFIWLYLMEDAFLERLQRLEAIALLLLAYYAPLLKLRRQTWYLAGWPDHIISSVRYYLAGRYDELLQWPMRVLEAI